MLTTWTATCNGATNARCAFVLKDFPTSIKAEACAHEKVCRHRVTVWDTSTSHLPRAMWTDQPVPVLAADVAVAA